MATPLRPALDLLKRYAEYHRDRRNIVTHFFGVPMIVFAVGVLLTRPAFGAWTPCWALFALAAAWYVTRGEFALGLATTAGIGLLMLAAHRVSDGAGTAQWLAWGFGFFVAGWVIQFVGHYYEGRRPALADDLVGLLVGPMFVVMELLALLGLFKGLVGRIEQHAGPTLIRDLAHPATR